MKENLEFDKMSQNNYLLHMRQSGLSYESIRQFVLEYFDYKVGVGSLTDYFKTFHFDSIQSKGKK